MSELSNAPAMLSADWVAVCRVDEVPPLGARRIARTHGAPVAVFRTATDAVHAVLDRCPHKGGPLSQGIVFGRHVACPLHNWTIDLATGCATAPDEGATPVFQLRVDGSTVYLQKAELDRLGIDLPLPTAGPCHAHRADVT